LTPTVQRTSIGIEWRQNGFSLKLQVIHQVNPYSYTANLDQADVRPIEETRNYRRYAVSFPSARPTEHAKMNTVWGDYYQPKGAATSPLAILLHGSIDPSIIPCRLLARGLAKNGIASFVLYMSLHTRRMPAEMRRRFPTLTNKEWQAHYRVSVTDVRQVIDWAENQPEIDSHRTAAIGISFGGFISAIAMAVDERIKAGVFIVSGGNSAKIALKSRTFRNRHKTTSAENRQTLAAYTSYLVEVANKGLNNVMPPMESFLMDPMTFAPLLRHRPIMMINARWDEVVPREATDDFWRAAGQPPISWLPATHGSIWLWYPLISRRITGFLRSTLHTPGTCRQQ
jgi:dienelactone hydrolase